jgi:hypothetical protein
MTRERRTTMPWLALWTALLIAGAFGLVACINRLRFARRVASEAAEMLAGSGAPRPLDRARLATLPSPVRRYLERALGSCQRTVGSVRIRHGGTFRASLDGKWYPIRGAQYFAADPPAFIWWGRIALLPGLWIEARDRSSGGTGHMLVRAESTFTLADVRGPELDQGALLRLLGEMVWFPTSFLDERHVRWSPLDDRRATATLRVGASKVSGVYEFGEDGLPTAFRADRYRDLGGGRSALTPFTGEFADFRDEGGLLVPHHMTALWHTGEAALPYARFLVERVDYDALTVRRRR